MHTKIKFLIFAVLFCSAQICFVLTCSAQDELFAKPTATAVGSGNQQIAVTPTVAATNTPQVRLDNAQRKALEEKSIKNSSIDNSPKKDQVIKHYRFGKGQQIGPIPTPTPLIDISKFIEEAKIKYQESVKQFPSQQELENYLKSKRQRPNINVCLDNKTVKVDSAAEYPSGLEGENSPYQDYLFIKSEDLPSDTELIFGLITIVVPFVSDPPNRTWDYIDMFNVPCLPYRIRLQKSSIYYDYGINALKNYSKNAVGEFHPYIKEVFLGEKQKTSTKVK
jgi:hypothetical protein